jgi:prepilin-type N-terminal cleavage/methylation domain-containing protein
MDSDILDRRAFSLIELALVLAITAILTALGLYSAKAVREAALAERTLEELSSIVVASTRYYNQNRAWPATLSDLRQSGYLVSGSSDFNPFGNAYIITGRGEVASVSTLLPKGLVNTNSLGNEIAVTNQGGNDLVTITKLLESATWGLKYEKKYIYGQ